MTGDQVQSGFFEHNGAKLYYEVTGEGQPLVFVHAGVADNRMWDDQVPHFAGKYRVIRYDMRGFGKSEPVDAEYSNREDLHALLKFLNVERAHLVGCSMGGTFCLALTLEHPEMAASLTMVCSGPGDIPVELDEPPELEERFEQASDAFKAKDLERAAELETQIWFDGISRTPGQVDPEKREKAKAMNLIALRHAAKELGKAKPGLTPPPGERLGELKIPVLAIIGALDEPYAAVAADYMMERIPDMKKVVIENTAHLPSLEHPDQFNRILDDFLTNL
jgi:pimeloyl-ACP methyl ester carboxylesterase